jgi:hypothetical protein
MTRLRLPLFMLAAASLCALLAVSSRAEDEPKAAPEKPVTGDAEAEVTALVDREISKVWERDGVTPAARSSDSEFVRRVYFDLTGAPPTPENVIAFLDDSAQDKRAKLIDALVADARFGRHIADQWSPILLGRSQKQKGGADHMLAVWMARQINAGKGFDTLVYDMIAASGRMSENPAVAYWAVKDEQRTPDFAGLASKHFTGVQIQCAQCHKHPYEEMTTDDFAGVASFFNGLRIRKDGNTEPANPSTVDERVKFNRKPSEADLKKLDEKRRKELEERLKYSSPRFLKGEPVKIEDTTLLRATYAKWVIAPENKQTRRYLANRYWSFIFGQGLQNPIDDFNSFNHPSHPELLEALADELLASKFNLQRFYRAILKSKTYQLSSSGGARKGANVETWHYAAYPVKQLSPEQFFASLLSLTTDTSGLRDARKRFEQNFDRVRKEAQRQADEQAKEKEKAKEEKPGDAVEGMKDGEAMDKKEAKKAAKEEGKKYKTFDLAALEKFEALYKEMPDDWFLRRTMCATYASRTSDDEMTEADTFSLTIDQALQVMNGSLTSKLSEYKKGQPIYELIKGNKDVSERVQALYLRVLSRKPSEAETKRTLEYIGDTVRAGSKVEQAWEDVLFALLMTTEFATNH